MKWIALKLKNLPIISLQIDRAIEVFESRYRNDLAVIAKFQTFRKRQDLIELTELKAQFENRVVDLEAFYKQHYLEDNIAIFHMLRIKLERALFKMNQLSQDRSFGEISFKEDSLSLFPENQIKILEQPLFTYYESSIKKNSKDDYFDFAKDAPKEQISSFGVGKTDKKSQMKSQLKNQLRVQAGSHLKNSSNHPNSQPFKINSQKQTIPAVKKNVKTNKESKDIKKVEKKPDYSFKPAKFTKSELQKIEEQKKKQKKEQSPQKSNELGQTNFLQCLNSQSQLKFTIKMTKQQYRSLLQMKKKISETGKY